MNGKETRADVISFIFYLLNARARVFLVGELFISTREINSKIYGPLCLLGAGSGSIALRASAR
jgi:hypothetical protein